MKILILGVTGMVGHKLFIELSKRAELEVWATARSATPVVLFGSKLSDKIIPGVEARQLATIEVQLERLKPDVVINAIGITKQLVDENRPREAIEINSLYPHQLAELCRKYQIRLIQMATDCVFNGRQGHYHESDPSDAVDTYGRTKFLGEVYYKNCLTIRTSFIGHELTTNHGLLDWFLAQEGQAKGYTQAIYSGLPTVEIARIMAEYILTNPTLEGLYHISSEPINKFDLLKLIAVQYGKTAELIPDDSVKIDRSLNSDRFRQVVGFSPKPWPDLIQQMYQDYNAASYYTK